MGSLLATLTGWFTVWPPLVQVGLLSCLPLVELRLALPYGLLRFDLPAWEIILTAWAGNLLSCTLVWLLLRYGVPRVRRHWGWFDRLCERVFTRTRQQSSRRMKRLGYLGLFLFIVVPLPGSGGWTGALIAYLFGVPLRDTVFILAAGLAGAALLVAGVTLGAVHLWG
ncbi:small multi-drug export protein [Candidatus Peribacteria bacterium]|nr:small multi-drug export protein [Candidatus Peribacteria bacterium]